VRAAAFVVVATFLRAAFVVVAAFLRAAFVVVAAFLRAAFVGADAFAGFATPAKSSFVFTSAFFGFEVGVFALGLALAFAFFVAMMGVRLGRWG
jgi:hypothetical protein